MRRQGVTEGGDRRPVRPASVSLEVCDERAVVIVSGFQSAHVAHINSSSASHQLCCHRHFEYEPRFAFSEKKNTEKVHKNPDNTTECMSMKKC